MDLTKFLQWKKNTYFISIINIMISFLIMQC